MDDLDMKGLLMGFTVPGPNGIPRPLALLDDPDDGAPPFTGWTHQQIATEFPGMPPAEGGDAQGRKDLAASEVSG